ncbi:hypothetical protein FOCC_FOCC013967 [Frankliniella occidentalis]|nr:hypothetical protein FOCC_FOCC013967 [Frankliniella occidentalis]
MVLGSQESPLLSKGPTPRKAAQNFRDLKLSVTKEDDEFRTVENMKRTIPFAGAIHDIRREDIQLPAALLISERQDLDYLTYWIKDWLRRDQSAKPAKYFLMKDVAHLTNNICKWKVRSTDGLKKSPTIGFNSDGDPVAAERSLQKLADAIASGKTFHLSVRNDNPAELERLNQHPDDFDSFSEGDVPSCLRGFIGDIIVSASLKAKEGDRISPGNSDEAYQTFVEYAHDFV